MKTGLYIRVVDEDEQLAERLKEHLLRGGFTPEDATLENVLNDHLYHLSRISTKLDNLGQLRHLFRIRQIVSAKFGEKMDAEKLVAELDRIQGRR